jgi:hypothetical protein
MDGENFVSTQTNSGPHKRCLRGIRVEPFRLLKRGRHCKRDQYLGAICRAIECPQGIDLDRFSFIAHLRLEQVGARRDGGYGRDPDPARRTFWCAHGANRTSVDCLAVANHYYTSRMAHSHSSPAQAHPVAPD